MPDPIAGVKWMRRSTSWLVRDIGGAGGEAGGAK